jgi:hypothetical protein
MVIAMSSYSPEEQRRILEAARLALEAAEQSLAEPRPEIEPPPVEDKLAKWKREANEQAERFARERAAGWPLTDYERAEFERDKLSGMVEEQKEFFLRLLAEVVAEVRGEFDQKLAALEVELGQVRAELTIAKAYSNNNNKKSEPSGEVVDLRKTA